MTQLIPPTTEAIMRETLLQEAQRGQEMAAAWQAYAGQYPDALEVAPNGPNPNVKVNRVGQIVDILTAYLFSPLPKPEIGITADGEDGAQISPQEAWLTTCLTANRWDAKALSLRTNGGVTGTPYIRIMQPLTVGGLPRIQVLDSTCMRIVTHPHDVDQIEQYIQQYSGTRPNPWTGKPEPAVFRQVTELRRDGWWIVDQISTTRPLTFTEDWQTTSELRWPYSWGPVDHCQDNPAANSVYGEPDASTILLNLNKALNFHLSDTQSALMYYSHPFVWVKGLRVLNFNVAPNRILGLQPTEEIGQIAPPPLNTTLEHQERVLEQAINEEGHVPAIAMGRPSVTIPPSGVAMRISFSPLVQCIALKRVFYGPLLIRLYQHLLEMGRHGSDLPITLNWPEIVPVDPVAERTALGMDLDKNLVSEETASTMLGYNYAQEKPRIDTARAARTPDQFTPIATQGDGTNGPNPG